MDLNLLSLPNSSSTSRWMYDVFLSFRGEDTRYKFTDHLYKALVNSGIKTFRDDELEKGKVISPELEKAIEKSRFAVVIISENYASSSWCLDELVKIIECKERLKMTVLPVFHYVAPTVVKKQTEPFKKAFDRHEKRFAEWRVKIWRDALNSVGNITGFELKNISPETQEIQRIVGEILCRLGNLAECRLKNISPETQDIRCIVRQISRPVRYECSELTNEGLVNFEKKISADGTAQVAFDMANMEELRMAASAYYWNASDEVRQRATEFFNSMDTDGDREVSFIEFVQFFVQNGYHWVDSNLFRSLDRDGNGFLDFSEVLTFYYIFKTRGVWCACCRNYLMGRYFTCVACFDNARCTGHTTHTYDLCSMCYEARRHQHQHQHPHNYFLDIYVLLWAKSGLPLLAGAPNVVCDYCGNYQMGLYFTCVECFDNARCTGHTTYDLCSMCYEARRHQQQHPNHDNFLDIYVLLRAKAGLPLLAAAPNFQQALVPRCAPNAPQQALVPLCAPNAPQQRRLRAFKALDRALTVGTMAAHLGCSIM